MTDYSIPSRRTWDAAAAPAPAGGNGKGNGGKHESRLNGASIAKPTGCREDSTTKGGLRPVGEAVGAELHQSSGSQRCLLEANKWTFRAGRRHGTNRSLAEGQCKPRLGSVTEKALARILRHCDEFSGYHAFSVLLLPGDGWTRTMALQLVKNDAVIEVDGVDVPEDEKFKVVDTRTIEEHDLLIVGAGISGINMSYRFQQSHPHKSYVVLEQREAMGGTWDLMRYPGVRSDSDLHTFGFAWRPWEEKEPIAEGYKIQNYLNESAAMYGIDKKILYRHKVMEANWQSREQTWTLTVEALGDNGSAVIKFFRAPFLVMATGYYDYNKPLQVKIPGLDTFRGTIVHPQFWPQDLDYANRKIAVIGSGATAVTLIPSLAKSAAKVTMVQRSPTYIVGFRNRTNHRRWWEWLLPDKWFHWLTRVRFLIGGIFIRRFLSDPIRARAYVAELTKKQLPAHIDFDPHFVPRYDPWAQRMCFCPDNDFFKALHNGSTDVVTGVIRTVTPDRIIMENGAEIEADIIVTATGLRVQYGGNTKIIIDGEKLTFGDKFLWRGIMISDVPNMAIVQGYTMASWTLGADSTATMVMRLLKYMQRKQISSATPRANRATTKQSVHQPGLMGLTSTYILTALHRLPKTTDEAPWSPRGNYLWDMFNARFANLSCGMQFTMMAR